MTNEICVYYNKPLYDQKVILRLLEFYKSNLSQNLFTGHSK
ncbi:hypothetical protein LEP1GSC085_0490 [Leptospira interrogans str. L0996]|nr:hypothetical protein LEP1GSC085_0490 [Leptospira interrogans str. L0996]